MDIQLVRYNKYGFLVIDHLDCNNAIAIKKLTILILPYKLWH